MITTEEFHARNRAAAIDALALIETFPKLLATAAHACRTALVTLASAEKDEAFRVDQNDIRAVRMFLELCELPTSLDWRGYPVIGPPAHSDATADSNPATTLRTAACAIQEYEMAREGTRNFLNKHRSYFTAAEHDRMNTAWTSESSERYQAVGAATINGFATLLRELDMRAIRAHEVARSRSFIQADRAQRGLSS